MAKFESGSNKGSVLTSANDDGPSLVPKALQSDEAFGGAALGVILGYLGVSTSAFMKAKEKYLKDVAEQEAKEQKEAQAKLEKQEKRAAERAKSASEHSAFMKDVDADIKSLDMMSQEIRGGTKDSRRYKNIWQAKKGTILGNTKGR
jgi:ATPase subunit of ABC transporter with duplicated ATPase domains